MSKRAFSIAAIVAFASILTNLVLCDRLRQESGRRVVVQRTSRERVVEPAATVARAEIKSREQSSAPDPARAHGEGGGVIRKSGDAADIASVAYDSAHSSGASSYFLISGISGNSGTDPLKSLDSRLGLTAAQRDFIDQAIRSQLDYEQRKRYDEMRATTIELKGFLVPK